MSKHGMTMDFDASLLGRRHTNRVAVPDRTFSLNAKEESDGKRVAEMLLFDFIGQDWAGEGLTAKRIEDELRAIGEIDEIQVLINSPGGSIVEALGIYNALVRHPANVVATNIGAAWSAASWILQAGDERQAVENATTMIHNGQGIAMGDRRVMTKEAAVLDKLDGSIATTYARRTGRRAETWRKMMDEETWFDASEALADKLIDRVIPGKSGAKNLNPASFGFNVRHVTPRLADEQSDAVRKSFENAYTGTEPKAANVLPRLRAMELESG